MAENSKKSIFALDDEEDVKQIDPSLSDSGIVTLETSPSVLVQSSQNDPEDDDDIQLVDEPFADGQDDIQHFRKPRWKEFGREPSSCVKQDFRPILKKSITSVLLLLN